MSAFCSEHNEATHSVHGALEETYHHYIYPCLRDRKEQPERFVIFEMGFGIGHGFSLTVKYLDDKAGHFYSFEQNRDFIDYAIKIYPELQELKESKNGKLDTLFLTKNDFQLTIILGDARENIKILKEQSSTLKFNAFYQDPFSPKRNPRLWTLEWFEDLYSVADKTAVLATYSASSSIRKALVESKWKVNNSKAFGKKKSFTIATIEGESDPSVITHLERSPALPYRDKNFKMKQL